jgi:beta-phosphoglucomutase family hydrolase
MPKIKAFIFDMDGTMFDNMPYHLQAWEKIMAELGSSLQGQQLFKQLYGKNTEVLERIFGPERFTEEEMKKISIRKDAYFREIYGPHLKLIKGLQHFLTRSFEENILLGIGTGGLSENIDFGLEKTKTRHLFSAIVSEADVENSKPDPETFLKTAALLKVDPSACMVFEDVPKGIEAAQRAGMKAVALLTSHQASTFSSFKNVIKMTKDYSGILPEDLV